MIIYYKLVSTKLYSSLNDPNDSAVIYLFINTKLDN